jgi:hypothetical protein
MSVPEDRLIFANASHVGTMTKAEATFEAGPNVQVTGTVRLLGADFDGNGTTDLAVLSDTGEARIWRVDEGGTLHSPVMTPTWSGAFDLEVADVTGDAKPELLRATSVDVNNPSASNISAYTVGSNSLTQVATVLQGTFADFAVGDLDADGHDDVVAVTASELVWRRGKGQGSFFPAQGSTPLPAAGLLVAMADLNLDGKDDAVVALGDNTVAIFPSDGATGFFDPAVVSYDKSWATQHPHPTYLDVSGDLNGDDIPDILLSTDVDVAALVSFTP